MHPVAAVEDGVEDDDDEDGGAGDGSSRGFGLTPE